ncbi:S41 family peptidase [bacterium]|nr:S41 family peptidase [bacterium]
MELPSLEKSQNKRKEERIERLKKFFLEIVLSVFILASLVYSVSMNVNTDEEGKSYNDTAISSSQDTTKTIPAINETINYIKKYHIRTIETVDMLNCAVENVNYTLDCFGIKEKYALKKITKQDSKNKTEEELIDSFKEDFIKALLGLRNVSEKDRYLHRSQLKRASKTRLEELKKEFEKKNKDDSEEPSVYDQVTQQAKSDAQKAQDDESKNKDDILKDENGKPYVLDPEMLVDSALNGLIQATEDPFSMALTPKECQAMKSGLGDESYGGVGIFLEADRKNNNQATVIEPVEGAPASKVDIQPGDQIIAVNGKKTLGLDIATTSALIRGPVGTKVNLTFRRGSKEFSIALERVSIVVPSVSYKVLENSIGYIRLRFFGPSTDEELNKVMKEVNKGNIKGLILDLRNNGGGYVTAAISLVSQFIPKNKRVTCVINPRINEQENYDSLYSNYTKLPVVLLVNRFSASASEITAGALKDYQRALIIGEKTYGKGSVQNVKSFTDGGALKLTIAHYLTPKDKDIHLKGIIPHIKLEAEPTNKLATPQDKQFALAITKIKEMIQKGDSNELSDGTIRQLGGKAEESAR